MFSSSEDAVGAVDLPHVAVGIGERAGIPPALFSSLEDELGAGVLRATHERVDCRIGRQPGPVAFLLPDRQHEG